jgi:hypothetical protein
VVDSAESSDVVVVVIISDQDDDSDADGATVNTDMYVCKDMVSYVGEREMFTGVNGLQDSA